MLELCKKKERIGRIERDVINILPFLGAEDILSLESHPFPWKPLTSLNALFSTSSLIFIL